MISFHGNTACTVTLRATVTAGVRGTGVSRLSASGHFPSHCHSNSTISEEFMRVSLCFVTVKEGALSGPLNVLLYCSDRAMEVGESFEGPFERL